MTGPEIAEAVNKIIKKLKRRRNKDFKHESINWANLGAVEIHAKHEMYPGESEEVEVLIEEAASEARNFCEAVEIEFYEEHGFFINVKTEWKF